MGFKNNAYAKVWKVNMQEGRNPSAQITITRKNKQTGEYITEFSGFVDCLFDAKDKITGVAEGARIKILSCDINNTYNKDTKETRWYPKLMDFEVVDTASAGNYSPEEADPF